MTQFLTPGSQILNYLVFPKFLLEIDDLNETAKILYMILLGRARLSQKNDRWTDENGHVYLFFTIPSLADAMHKSEMTIKTALKHWKKNSSFIESVRGSDVLTASM